MRVSGSARQFTLPAAHYECKTTVLRPDDPATNIFVVHRGRVRVYTLSATGDERTHAVLSEGQVFGTGALLRQESYGVFVEALTNLDVWSLPVERLHQGALNDPMYQAVLRRLVHALAGQMAVAEATLRDVALLPVSERIPNALARLKDPNNAEPIALTREHLASLVGARRETVSRVAPDASRERPVGRPPASTSLIRK